MSTRAKSPTIAPAALSEALKELGNWSVLEKAGEINRLHRIYTFANYLSGLTFVQKIALKAEEADHHPDILLQWGKVTVSLFTHDSGGITEKDLNLAKTFEDIFLLNS